MPMANISQAQKCIITLQTGTTGSGLKGETFPGIDLDILIIMIAAQSPKFIEACSTHNLQYLKGFHKHFDGVCGRGQFLLWKTLFCAFWPK